MQELSRGPVQKQIDSQVPKFIWIALTISQLLLFDIASNGVESGRSPVLNWQQNQPVFFGIAAIDWFVAWLVIPKILSSGIRSKTRIISQNQSTTPQLNVRSVFPIMAVQWVLFESVSLFGFVLATQAASQSVMIPFLGAGVLGLILTFPSQTRINELMNMVMPGSGNQTFK